MKAPGRRRAAVAEKAGGARARRPRYKQGIKKKNDCCIDVQQSFFSIRVSPQVIGDVIPRIAMSGSLSVEWFSPKSCFFPRMRT